MEYKWLAIYEDGTQVPEFERMDVPAGAWDFLQPIACPKVARYVVPMKDNQKRGATPLESGHDFEMVKVNGDDMNDGRSEIRIFDRETMNAKFNEGCKVSTKDQDLGIVLENSIHRDVDRRRIRTFTLTPTLESEPHLVVHVPEGAELIYRKREQRKQTPDGAVVGRRLFWIVGWQMTRELTVIDDRNPNAHKNVRINQQCVNVLWENGKVETMPRFMEPGEAGSRAELQMPGLLPGERWMPSETIT